MIIAVDIYHRANQKSLYSFVRKKQTNYFLELSANNFLFPSFQVCSVDHTFCRYFSGVQVLAPASECNIHVGEILQKGLDCFKKESKIFP